MRIYHRLLLLALAISTTVQINAQEKLHAYLPADAKAIVNINLLSLGAKMSWQEVKNLPFFEESMKEAPLQMQEFLKNPLSTGINFMGGIYIVMMPDNKNKTKPAGYLYGAIADTAKFAATIKKMSPKSKISNAGNIRLLVDDKNVIAWNPEIFVIPMPAKDKRADKKLKDAKASAARTKELLTQSKLLLAPVAKSISTDERFMQLTRESGEVRFWINKNLPDTKTKGKKSDEIMKMMNIGILQQGNYMAGVLRFEAGKAVVQLKSYMNKTMDSLYKQYPSVGLNKNLLRKLPGGQPVVLLSFSVSPEMLGSLIKASGAEKLVDSLSKKSSIKPMDVISGLNGDLTLAIIRATEFEEQDSVTAALGGMQIFLAASIKDKAKVQPFIDQLQKPKEAKKKEEEFEKKSNPFGGLKPALLLNDSFFVVSISSFAAEKFLSSTTENEVIEMTAPYAGNSSLFALDLKTIIGFAMQMSKKPQGENDEMKQMMETFDKIFFYGGRYENGAMISTGELHFSNKEENSLKQFLKLGAMAAEMEKQKKERALRNGVEDEEVKQ